MHRTFKVICAAAVLLTSNCCFLLTSCGSAESSADSEETLNPDKCGTFVGTVYKELNGDILPGVRVTAENVKNEKTYSVRTGPGGKYELLVPPGKYTLSFFLDGYYGFATHEYKIKKGESVETDKPVKLSAVIRSEDSADDASSASESSAVSDDTPAQPAVFDNCDEAYSAFLDGILARSEYRGVDGKPINQIATVIDYIRFDMDHDGVDELIINTGSTDADRSICFYTFRYNTVQLIGYNFSGAHVFNYVCDNSTQQLVTEWEDNGRGGAAWYHYDGSSVRITKENGPKAYEPGDGSVLAENCSPLDFKSGYRRDSDWIFN